MFLPFTTGSSEEYGDIGVQHPWIIFLKIVNYPSWYRYRIVFTSWRDVREVEGDGLEIRYVACLHRGFESLSLRTNLSQHSFGEVSEWSKVHDWKSCKVKSLRGFESPPLRNHNRCWCKCVDSVFFAWERCFHFTKLDIANHIGITVSFFLTLRLVITNQNNAPTLRKQDGLNTCW